MKSISFKLSPAGTEIVVTERVFHGVERPDYTEIYRMGPDEANDWIKNLTDLRNEAHANIAAREGEKLTELRKEHARIGAEIKRLSECGL